jgi:hypothetical protein
MLDNFEPGLLNIAIDRKVDSIVDLDDAMKVQMRGNNVTALAKICGAMTRLILACLFALRRSSRRSSRRRASTVWQ